MRNTRPRSGERSLRTGRKCSSANAPRGPAREYARCTASDATSELPFGGGSEVPDDLRVEFGQYWFGREEHVYQSHDISGPHLGLHGVGELCGRLDV